RVPRRDFARRPAAAAGARLRAARGLAPAPLPRAAGHDRPVAGLGPDQPLLRRAGSARLLLPRELVDLARHHDPVQDAARGRRAARRVLEPTGLTGRVAASPRGALHGERDYAGLA